jgi:hypothetical protein
LGIKSIPYFASFFVILYDPQIFYTIQGLVFACDIQANNVMYVHSLHNYLGLQKQSGGASHLVERLAFFSFGTSADYRQLQ